MKEADTKLDQYQDIFHGLENMLALMVVILFARLGLILK
jgi:hypothetical protein